MTDFSTWDRATLEKLARELTDSLVEVQTYKPASPTYRIKPLVWTHAVYTHSECESATTIVGYANIFHGGRNNSKVWLETGGSCHRQVDSLDHGKQLAEAWYRGKLLEALQEAK